MKSINKTTAFLVAAIAFALISGVAYVYLFLVMKNKTDATADVLVKVAELSGKGSHLISSASLLKNESINIDKLSSYFIRENEIVAFAKRLEDLGPQSGTTLSLQSLDPGLTERGVQFLSFQINAKGNFAAVERLLVLLENFPGKLEWKTVRLVKGEALAPQGGEVGTQRASSPSPLWDVEVFLTALNFIKE